MRGSKLGLSLTLGCMLAGCAQEGEFPDGGQSLRAAGETVDFWNFRLNDPGNGDVEMSDGMDDDSLPDTIIVTLPIDTAADVYDLNGGLIVSTFENQIFDPGGNLTCTAYFEDGLYKLREGLNGDVVLTATQGRYVFWGDVQSLPAPGTYAWQHLLYNELAYEFYGDVLYDGPRWYADVVAEANVHIHKANPMRKLLIAALYEGECGTSQPSQPENPPPG